MGGGAELLFQARSADERGGTVELVGVAHFIRNWDVALRGGFLLNQGHGEELQQGVHADWLLGGWVKNRGWRDGVIGVDVVPLVGNIVFRKFKTDFGRVRHDSFSFTREMLMTFPRAHAAG